MTTKLRDFLPNELRFQITTKPNPRVLDIRGDIATQLSKKVGVTDWSISENTVSVFEPRKERVFVIAFKAIGLSITNSTMDRFSENTDTLFSVVESISELSEFKPVAGVSINATFFTPNSLDFDGLMGKVRKYLGDLHPKTLSCFGSDAVVTDIGVNAHLRARGGEVRYFCGPERREIVSAQHLRRHSADALPEVGLLCGIELIKDDLGNDANKSWSEWAKEVNSSMTYLWETHDKLLSQIS